MVEKEIKVAGVNYRVGVMDARKQFHVARRLAPVFAELAPVLKEMLSMDKEESDEQTFKVLELAAGPLANAIAEMSDPDADYVIDNCLRVCYIQQESAWAPLTAPNGSLMFPMQLPQMLELVVSVIKENLGDFFPTGLLSSQAASSQSTPS